jgi:GNAT superfamily N-acetyltransferase
MKIFEYGQVDPLEVLHLNMLCLGFQLTPELASVIHLHDPRAFPFFCLYAQVDNSVAGQVGVFRLPVVSTEGADEVGGVWAVCGHPEYANQGIATGLLKEAHARMRAAGLRFSTLGTDRYRVAHRLYEKLGYQDVFSSPSIVARQEKLPETNVLRAAPAGHENLSLADQLFEQIAAGGLGFARRHRPFFLFLERRSYLRGEDLWIIWRGKEAVGYALAFLTTPVLRIANLLLFDEIDPLAAVAAVTQQTGAAYVQVTIDQLAHRDAFEEAGLQLAGGTWGTFMVKPLVEDLTVDDFRRLYGPGTDRFFISNMDIT